MKAMHGVTGIEFGVLMVTDGPRKTVGFKLDLDEMRRISSERKALGWLGESDHPLRSGASKAWSQNVSDLLLHARWDVKSKRCNDQCW